MESSVGLGLGLNLNALHRQENQVSSVQVQDIRSDHYFYSVSALDITIRILRYNASAFVAIVAVLIFPVSATLLSNVLVDQSLVMRLTLRLLLIMKSSGLPLTPLIRQSCQKISEMVVSTTMCFPLFITLLLLSKAAVVHSVDCAYSRKKFDSNRFYGIILKIWKRIFFTYLWVCMVITSCPILFLVLQVLMSFLFLTLGFKFDMILYPTIAMGFVFSVILANAIIICNIAIVISVVEDVSGPQALLRSCLLIRGQTQVGLLIFLGSTIGVAFVEGLFEHRVKTIINGDGHSRIWEGPLLVVMYSFVLLIDSMMTAVFYFRCKSYRMDDGHCSNRYSMTKS